MLMYVNVLRNIQITFMMDVYDSALSYAILNQMK